MFLLGALLAISGVVYVLEQSEARTERIITGLESLTLLEVETESEGLQSERTIYYIDQFVSSVRRQFPRMNQYQVGRRVMRALGNSEEQVDEMSHQQVLLAADISAAIISESFFSTRYDEVIEMNEHDFWEDVARNDEQRENSDNQESILIVPTATAVPGLYDTQTSEDGNFRLRTTILRLVPRPNFPNRFTYMGPSHMGKTR